MGSTWQSFQFICDWWTKIDYLNFAAEIRLFENLKNLYPPKGSAKALPMGSNWFSYGLLSFVTSELKMDFQFWGGNSSKKIEKKPLLCGWDGWTDGRGIKSVLRFSSNSSMLTSKMCWFQIWCLKLSAAFLSEVMSISIFKIPKFKGRQIWGKRRKNMVLVKIL